MKFKITEIQRFCMHDGPGVRTTVFLAGCPLRCAWCHNPETQSAKPQTMLWSTKCIGCGACVSACAAGAQVISEDKREIDRSKCTCCGECIAVCPTGALESSYKLMSEDEIVAEVIKDKAFFGARGGVTLSGGEPTAQAEVIPLLERFKALGINTALETCGYFDSKIAKTLVDLVDVFLWDIKDTCDTRHREYTGVSNAKIIENLRLVDSLGAKSVMRCIMVRGVNMNDEHIDSVASLWRSLNNCECVELLAYHTYGGSKSEAIGLDDNGRKDWIPSSDEMLAAKEKLRALGVSVK